MLTLQEAKLHCRIDHSEEDLLIYDLIDTATAAVGNYLNLPVSQFTGPIPAPIKSAALLLVADLYENREISYAAKHIAVSGTFERLLNPYRLMV